MARAGAGVVAGELEQAPCYRPSALAAQTHQRPSLRLLERNVNGEDKEIACDISATGYALFDCGHADCEHDPD